MKMQLCESCKYYARSYAQQVGKEIKKAELRMQRIAKKRKWLEEDKQQFYATTYTIQILENMEKYYNDIYQDLEECS